MPEESTRKLEGQLAKLGKEVVLLRVGLILALVVLALVVVAVLQLRAPVAELTVAQTAPATVTAKAARYLLLDAKGTVRGELNIKDDVPRLELLDADGKVIWTTPVPSEPAPKGESGTKEEEK